MKHRAIGLLLLCSPGFLAQEALSGCVSGELDDVREQRVETHVDDWRDEVIYQLLVDRFANSEARNDYRLDRTALAAYQGGDWQGVIDNMDYIEELGVTTLWISPVVLNVDTDAGVDGYHGYWAIDLERVNPHFGDLPTLRRMVNEAHRRGLKVILDLVTNHLGQAFYYDINRNGQPDENVSGGLPVDPGNPSSPRVRSPVWHITEYDPDYDSRTIQSFTSLGESGDAPIRFFDMPEIYRIPPRPELFSRPEAYNRRGRVNDWNVREQVMYGDFPGGLKDVNTENPDVREEMVRVYVDWVLKADFDGFRIDTLKHVDYGFWEYFTAEVRRRLAERGKTNFLMFGEAFDGDDTLVGSYTMPGQLDSVFYFPQKFQVFDDVFGRGQPTRKIRELYEQRDEHYGADPQVGGIGISPRQALVNFIDNHDVPRFMFNFPHEEQLRAALTYLLTEDGIPCIYYGTEQGYLGGNDPANREPLWWSDYDTSGDLFRYTSRLIRARRQYTALRRGSFEIVWTTEHTGDEMDAGILAFERRASDGSYALVVFNTNADHPSFTSTTEEGDMPVNAAGMLVDALTGEMFAVDAGKLKLMLEPHQSRILVPMRDYVAIE